MSGRVYKPILVDGKRVSGGRKSSWKKKVQISEN